jgi:hypothetical protein
VTQQTQPGTTRSLGGQVSQLFRRGALFMATGSAVFAIGAVFLLSQSGAGVVTFAEGRAGTAITIPATATNPLVVFAVPAPGALPLDVECTTGVSSDARVGLNYGPSARLNGRTLRPVGELTSSWRAGDTLTCTGTGFESVVLGHNSGLTHLLQGLLAVFAAVGAGLFAVIGFALRRHGSRP